MKRYIVLIPFMFASALIFGSDDIRDNVVIVQTEYTEEATDTYSSIADWLISRGKRNLAGKFSNTGGVRGSGFLLQLSNGTQVVVTNHHVVKWAERIDVEFQDRDGNSIVHNDCQLLVYDPDRDLAILSLSPMSEIPGNGLALETELVEDGRTVWSAGYPGLMDKPAWQLGQGVITNQQARIAELFRSKNLDYLIQHSAIIDPGSSGGPLLVGDAAGGYRVVGVNTWGFESRDNTYFSVPSAELLSHLESIQEQKAPEVEDRIEEFLDTVSSTDDYLDWRGFLSDDLGVRYGWTLYLRQRRDADEEWRDENDSYMFGAWTSDALKEAVFRGLLNSLTSSGEVTVEDDDIEVTVSIARVTFTIAAGTDEDDEEKQLRTTWQQEGAQWRLSGFSSDDLDDLVSDDSAETSALEEFDYGFALRISLGMGVPMLSGAADGSSIKPQFGFVYESSVILLPVRYAGVSIGFEIPIYLFQDEQKDKSLLVASFAIPTIKAVLQWPILIREEKNLLTPFVTGGVGFEFAFNVDDSGSSEDFRSSEKDSLISVKPYYMAGVGLEFASSPRADRWGFEIIYRHHVRELAKLKGGRVSSIMVEGYVRF